MAISVVNIGPNSTNISFASGDTAASILAAVTTWLGSHGWTVFDSSSASQTVMSAPNADGLTSKYIGLDISVTGYLALRVYESWNATSHVGTNETQYILTSAYNTFGAALASSQVIQSISGGGTMLVCATNRYVLITSKVAGSTGYYGDATFNSWMGAFEIANDYGELTGLPLFARVEGRGFLGFTGPVKAAGVGPAANNAATATAAYFTPRDADGASSAGNYRNTNFLTTTGWVLQQRFNYTAKNWSGGPFQSIWVSQPAQEPPLATLTASGAPLVSDIIAAKHVINANSGIANPSSLRGRFYGLKLVQGVTGNTLDSISVSVDSQGFVSPTGTPTSHIAIAQPYAVRYSGAVSASSGINYANMQLTFLIPA